MNYLTLSQSPFTRIDGHQDSLRSALVEARRELEETKKQLVNVDMKLMSRSSLLKDLTKSIEEIRCYKDSFQMKKALYKLKSHLEYKLDEDHCWETFESHFNLVQSDFYQRIKSQYTNLSITDLELCAYLRMEMCNKDIANQLNISVRGVETRRYRLKKKLQLAKNQNLVSFLCQI